jgi:hypothetical protein
MHPVTVFLSKLQCVAVGEEDACMRNAINFSEEPYRNISDVPCILCSLFTVVMMWRCVLSSGLHSYCRQGCNNIRSLASFVLRDINTTF